MNSESESFRFMERELNKGMIRFDFYFNILFGCNFGNKLKEWIR